jgi:hypothetical protein
MSFTYLVPELFDTNRRVGLTSCPQDGCTFSTYHNPMMLLPGRNGCRLNETTRDLEKSRSVRHAIEHKCGERFVGIQRNVSASLGGGVNIQSLSLQFRSKTIPVRLGKDNDSRTTRVEGISDEPSKGVKKKLVVGIELNLMAVRISLVRGGRELVVFEAATNKSLASQNRIHCRQQFASGINLTNVTPRARAQSCLDDVEITVLA